MGFCPDAASDASPTCSQVINRWRLKDRTAAAVVESMNVTTPAAFLSVSPQGFAIVCAWHDEIVPGSKRDAESFAHAQGLKCSHGVCPVCKARMIAEVRNTNTQHAHA